MRERRLSGRTMDKKRERLTLWAPPYHRLQNGNLRQNGRESSVPESFEDRIPCVRANGELRIVEAETGSGVLAFDFKALT